MSRPYVLNILMIEDNLQYKGSFEAEASKERIVVKTVDNAEDLIIALRENPRKFSFIVLDAKAFFTDGQAKGSESEANLIYIFREFKNIEKDNGVVLKYAINTGFTEIKNSYQSVVDCPIFDKGDEKILFDYIWKSQSNTEVAFVKTNYPEIIPLYERFFTGKVQEKVISLFNKHGFNNASLSARLSNLSGLRMINEHILDILLESLHGKAWNEITESIGSRSKSIAVFLRSHNDISESQKDLCINIYKSASKYGEHSEEDLKCDEDFPSYRMISGHAMGLLELFKTANKLLNL